MKNSTLNIQGRSRSNYVFHTYRLPAKLTSVGGVFFYLKLQKNGDFKILKLGHTHNFEQELQSDTAKKLGATHITALQKNSNGKREQIIRDLKHLIKR